MRRKPQQHNRGKQTYLIPIKTNGMTPYLHAFIEHYQTLNYSQSTINDREFAVAKFIEWCGERALNVPQDITKPILERYQRHLYHYRKKDGKPLGFRTQAQRLQAIKVFFKWLTKHNHILYNPASEIELPRLHKQLPRYLLSQDDINAILEQTQTEAQAVALRDRAIIETLYSTGMRRMEITNLKLFDIELEQGTVFIHQGKGQKDRVVPIGERACAWIRKYIDDVRFSLVIAPDESYVFISDYGIPYRNNQLGDMVKKYMRKAGIDKPGACHLFRHAMATHMLENGADIRYIQAILGHSDLSTTQVYTQVNIKKLKEIHSATHPAKLERQQTSAQCDTETEDALLTLLAEEVETESDASV